MEVFQATYKTLKWDVLLLTRRKGDWAMPLLFFTMVCTILPLSQNAAVRELRDLAPGMLWVACVLSMLLSFETLYRDNFKEGVLEQLLLCPLPLSCLFLGKSCAHWLVFSLPLMLIAFIFGLMMHLSMEALVVLLISFLLGTPIMILMASMGVALTVGLQKSSLMLAILMLPLWVPIIILGSTAVLSALYQVSYWTELSLLAALCIMGLLLIPKAIAFIFRESIY